MKGERGKPEGDEVRGTLAMNAGLTRVGEILLVALAGSALPVHAVAKRWVRLADGRGLTFLSISFSIRVS